MAITLTKTDIVNGALSLLAQPPISDLDSDEAEEGDVARIWYERTRQQCFAQVPWKFLQTTVELTGDLVPTNPRFPASFLVPDDFVSLTECPELDLLKIYYFLEGDRVIVDAIESTILLSYTFQEENVGRYSPWFVEWFEYELASKMSYALLKDRLRSNDMAALAQSKFLEAANKDGQQERNFEYIIDELAVVRNLRA